MGAKVKGVGVEKEEEFDGMHTAYIVGAVLLAATFWASPAMGALFAVALVVCAAICAIVLSIACAIGLCDSAVTRVRHTSRPATRHSTVHIGA